MAQIVKIGENCFAQDPEMGYYPLFSSELNRRVANKEACVIVVCGEAGTSKSYTAIQLARNIDKRFNIDQIIFTYSDYVKELGYSRRAGIPIVFDEPSYAMGKREWYKQINQALVKTIESQRFLVRPLIIPIININLLDKTLRDYLVIFQVHMIKRGIALVYRMKASQGEDKLFRYTICKLVYPILDFEKCPREAEYKAKLIEYEQRKARGENVKKPKSPTCLGCKDMKTCDLLRAQYERKKEAIQLARYEQDEEQAKQRESKEITLDQLCAMILPYEGMYSSDSKIDARKLRFVFHEKLGIKIGHNRSYEVKTVLEMRNKDVAK